MEVEYRRYVRENKARFMIEILRHGAGRQPSRRKRDEDEERVLTQLDMLRWRKTMEKGKIVYLGEGKYRIIVEVSNQAL